MATKNEKYWAERFKQLEASQYHSSEKLVDEIQQQMRRTEAEIERKINAWYGRLMANNGVSMAEVRRLLNNRELEEFRWNVNDYIKHGQENAYTQQWMKELENASARAHISRLEQLKLQVQQEAEKLYGNYLDSVDRHMKFLYEEGFYKTAYEIQKGVGVGWNLTGVDSKRLEKIIRKPWAVDGKNFSERIWSSKKQLIDTVHTSLTQMCILGQSPDRAINSLAKAMQTSKNQAGRLIMTEAAFFGSEARKDSFNELGVEQYEIVATLDSITSEICREMDGKVFPMSEYAPGSTAPPFHVWCRTTTVPAFGDEFDHIGERAARDADGKTFYVPADMTYKEWKDSFVNNGDKSGLQDASGSAIINSDNWKGLNYQQSYTKKTAISRLQNEYNIQFHDSKKYPMDDGLLADCVGWLDSFSSQYSGFMKKNPCKIPVINNKAPSGMKGSVGYYLYYTNGSGVVELALNGQYHSDIAAFQKYVERCVKSKRYPANATIHKTFVHEFGHHVSNSMRWITGNKNWQHEFIQECIDDFKKVEPNYIWNTYAKMGDYVSTYGATSESELFAEAFAEYFGGQNPRAFAKIFGKKLDALLKGVK